MGNMGGIGVGGSGDGGSNRGVVGDHRDSSDTGDDSAVGLASSDLVQGVGTGLSLPLAIVDTVVKSRDGSGVVDGRGGIADNRGGGDNGPVSGAVTSVNEGQGSTIGLACGDLAQGVGLGLPLAIVDTVVKGRDGSGVVHGRGGIADNRGGGDNGSVSGAVSSINEGQGSTVGLSSGDLSQGVGGSISLPLAIVDTVVKGGDGSVADNRGGIVKGDPTNLGHASLGGVGDDTDVVKTTLSQSILSGSSSGDLGHSPGLGVSRDSHDGQAENERFHG